ncbi:osmotically inducible protein OsmC [Aliifodinibius salipaludis]|uniref:Osmotically inducible protein OsmC n=1 Tax=Fodinibius salipaludis TaxID=2032627 RepID=A0A2A2GBM4_9BACT|nr:OsmC family protein [Aliifodinibius salipaludis]PAU95106.1 osmotically inducible protein OsmC [Aliifodinibius salipaludis]
MSDKKHEYNVDLNWKEDRTGMLSSPELDEQIEVATPPPFEGGVEGVWSPEHLFVSSVSSCFMTTFVAIAQYSKLKFENLEVHATGKLDKENGKFVVSEITLQPELTIAEEKFADKAKRIMEKAEEACLITRSIKTKIHFEPKVTIGALN